MGRGGQTPEGAIGEAVPRALAQPPEPGREEVLLDRGRGSHHLQSPLHAGKPLGRDRQAAAWKVETLKLLMFIFLR